MKLSFFFSKKLKAERLLHIFSLTAKEQYDAARASLILAEDVNLLFCWTLIVVAYSGFIYTGVHILSTPYKSLNFKFLLSPNWIW